MPNTIILVHVFRRFSSYSMQHSCSWSSGQSYDADLFSFTFPDLWRSKVKSSNILIPFSVSNIYSYVIANKKDDWIENRKWFAHMATTVSKTSSLGSSKINEVWFLWICIFLPIYFLTYTSNSSNRPKIVIAIALKLVIKWCLVHLLLLHSVTIGLFLYLS